MHLLQQTFQPVQVDIPAAQHGDRVRAVGGAGFAGQERGEWGGGGGFDDLFGAGHDEFEGHCDFVVGDEDDVVDQASGVRR
jgi:hypothetical protein